MAGRDPNPGDGRIDLGCAVSSGREFGFRVDELHGDGVTAVLFNHAHNFRLLGGIERGSGGGIWKCHFKTLAFPIAGARGGE